MRSVDVRDDLADGVEPSALPPIGPDGAPKLSPLRPCPPEPPRLCSAGPCRHYHRFQIQLDAQNPMDERKPDGTVSRHGRVFHVQTHHYCYPDVGIETNLGALPVLECNRWVPVRRLFRGKRAARRDFDRELADWTAAQSVGIEDVTMTATDIDTDAILGKKLTLRVGIAIEGQQHAPHVVDEPVMTNWMIRDLVGVVLSSIDWAPKGAKCTVEIVASFDPADLAAPTAYREPIDNLDATVEQLELSDGERLLVTLI